MKLKPVKATINYSDLEKVDIRVGTIEKAEVMEKPVPEGAQAG